MQAHSREAFAAEKEKARFRQKPLHKMYQWTHTPLSKRAKPNAAEGIPCTIYNFG